jgi:hypothetical protein
MIMKLSARRAEHMIVSSRTPGRSALHGPAVHVPLATLNTHLVTKKDHLAFLRVFRIACTRGRPGARVEARLPEAERSGDAPCPILLDPTRRLLRK